MEKIQSQIDSPQPNPELLKLELETNKAKDAAESMDRKAENEERESLSRCLKTQAETDLIVAQTMKTIAEAEAVEPGQQLEQYKAFVDDMKRQQQHERELKKIGIDREESEDGQAAGTDTEGDDAGMVAPPSDQGSPAMPPGDAQALPDPSSGGGNPEPQLI